ncbi:nucleotide pyrophosphohydrolase [Nocardia sp. NPDC059246]|uniref:nucleotide pyrophosphohydrolase n=1 Tax=unclassified Nocardia TaxID=2637762 RepID=UPI0036C9020E
MNAVDTVVAAQRAFVRDRDWEQFHTPKNLAMALGGELGELAEAVGCLLDPLQPRVGGSTSHIAEELGDVTLYLLRLHDVTGIEPTLSSPTPAQPEHRIDLTGVICAICKLAASVGRVLEHFQWESEDSSTLKEPGRAGLNRRLNTVTADLSRLSDLLGIDPIDAAAAKISHNAQKYPVATSLGSARKYTTFEGEHS